MKARKIILDCDPGHDDVVAIFLALGNPSIDLLGITTVGGNQTLDKVTRNARGVLATLGREDVKVYAGAERPLIREVSTAGSIHGESGLDGVELAQPTTPLGDKRAAQFIVDTIMGHDAGEVTLVATGPLTNLALAARLEPAIVDRVAEVVLMGGGFHEANWTAVAEFNIWVDPHAAHIVFEESWPVTMVGLDLTHQALVTSEVCERIAAIGTAPATFFSDMMVFFRHTHQGTLALDDPPLHDPCAVAYVIDPSIVVAKPAPVRVETTGDHTMGMTVVDLRANAPEATHTSVAFDLDCERFWDVIVDAIRRLGDM